MKPATEYDNADKPKNVPLIKSIASPAINPVIEPKIFPSETDIYTTAINTKSGVIFNADKDISHMKVFCNNISITKIAMYLIYFTFN